MMWADNELHFPAISSACDAPSKKRSTDTSTTESHCSSRAADESAATTTLTSRSPCVSHYVSVDDPPSLSTAVESTTSTGTSLVCTGRSQLLSANTADDVLFNSGRESDVGIGDDGWSRPNQLRVTFAIFDEAHRHRTSPRAAAQTRDQRRQSGFRGDDEGVIRNRLTKFNHTTSFNTLPKISGAFEATKNDTTGGMRYSDNFPGSGFCRRRPEVSTSGPDDNPLAATGNRKNQLSVQFRSCPDDVAVRSQQPMTFRPSLYKTPANPTSVRRTESSVVRPINTRRTEARHERPAPVQTSMPAEGDDMTEEEQRERIINWLGSVIENVEGPPSPDIDDSPTPVQTDTAIHVVYNGD